MSFARAERDPLQPMIVWSFALHGLVLTAIVLAAGLRSQSRAIPPPVGEFINISLGQSGPLSSTGGAATPAPKPPPPKPEPPPEPPKEKAPEVVRPTKEVRDEIPSPDARTTRKKPEPKPDSGVRGADAASAPSAVIQPSAGGGGLEVGGAGGGSAFDQDFEYAYYVQQMMAKIQQHWQRTAVRGTAVVVIHFTIQRNGRVENPEVEASSGVAILDRSALRAVMLADPLPPLPNSYPRDQVGVHLRFTYSDQY